MGLDINKRNKKTRFANLNSSKIIYSKEISKKILQKNHTTNAIAKEDGLINGDFYHTDGDLKVVFNESISPLFKMTIDTTQPGSAADTFVLPLANGATNMTVYWGDGNSDLITAYNQAELTHVYASSGSYQVTLDGSFSGIRFTNAGDKLKVSSIDNWGTNQWGNMDGAFWGCSNMVGTYTDSPDTSLVTSMYTAFHTCSNFNSEVNFDTSNVVVISYMFNSCTSFDKPINFDTSSVTTMRNMFEGCLLFNQTINFDASLNTQMLSMFKSCTSLNSTITLTNASLTTNVFGMFRNCTSLNSAVTITNSSSLIKTDEMFRGCVSFDVPFTLDMSNVTSAQSMFFNCTVFNQPVSFNTSSATKMNNMFQDCIAFNQPIFFDMSLVTEVFGMFKNCTNFNQDISSFDITSLTFANDILSGSGFSTANYDLLLPAWDAYGTSNVTFHAGTAQYNAGAPATAHANMLGRGWTITDGGPI